MGYSDDSHMVRVDFFKPSGKWYTTEAVRWERYHGTDSEGKITPIHDAFLESLEKHLRRKHRMRDGMCQDCGRVASGDVNEGTWCASGGLRLAGMTAVCLEPYHEHACPLMVKVPGGEE